MSYNLKPNNKNSFIACWCPVYHCGYSTLQGHGTNADTYTVQETIKANQCTFLYIEDSDISKAYDNAIDFVAVQGGQVIRNKIHGAGDWCFYTKGIYHVCCVFMKKLCSCLNLCSL